MYRLLLLSALTLLFVACQPDSKKTNKVVPNEGELAIGHISATENYAKQIIITCDKSKLDNIDSLVKWIVNFQPGGLWFDNWPTADIQNLAKQLDTLVDIKPLFFVDYFNQLDLQPYPIWGGSKAFQDSIFWRGFLASGVNAVQFPESVFREKGSNAYFKSLQAYIGLMPTYQVSFRNKSLADLKALPTKLQNSKGFLWLDSLKLDSLPYLEIKKALNWQGLVVAHPASNHLNHLLAGADMVVVSDLNAFESSKFKQSPQTLRAYEAIENIKGRQKNTNYYHQSATALLKAARLHFTSKSTAILNLSKKMLPLKSFKTMTIDKFLRQDKLKDGVVVIADDAPDSVLNNLANHKNAKITLFLFTNPEQYGALKEIPNLIFAHQSSSFNNIVLKAQIQGKLPIKGHLVAGNILVKGKKINGQGLVSLPPEYAFVDGEILQGIDGLASAAINGEAFPGCQVFAIKDNVILFKKSFGFTDYSRQTPVNNDHLYDLASLTKALATTLVGMKLWEDGHFKLEDELSGYLPDSLNKYLPNGSTLKNITFQELLTHKSGLPAGFPVISYMRKAADINDRFMNGFCDFPYTDFQTEVGADLFLENSFQDSMWITLNSLWLDPNKEFKYSDVNMNVLYFLFKQIIESKELTKTTTNKPNGFENYLYTYFYEPLTMKSTRYKPLKHVNKSMVIPTENDRFWRKQLLHGHVHDPNAALYGGVAGNAGLFSTAADIGNLLAMWQNFGVFKGERYLKAETIQKFSSSQPNTHRGLGFNKRTFTNAAYAMADAADASSYGHTGFTGTCFWVDPVNQISYVFLSNRVHPTVSRKIYEFNVRKRIHEVFYSALLQ